MRECADEEGAALVRGSELVPGEHRACGEEQALVEEEASGMRMLLVLSLFMLSRCFSFVTKSGCNEKYIQCKKLAGDFEPKLSGGLMARFSAGRTCTVWGGEASSEAVYQDRTWGRSGRSFPVRFDLASGSRA